MSRSVLSRSLYGRLMRRREERGLKWFVGEELPEMFAFEASRLHFS